MPFAHLVPCKPCIIVVVFPMAGHAISHDSSVGCKELIMHNVAQIPCKVLKTSYVAESYRCSGARGENLGMEKSGAWAKTCWI